MSSEVAYKIVMLVLCLLSIKLGNADEPVFSRTRHKAGLLTLIEYDDSPAYQKYYACKKAQICGICRMMVQEGGYEPKRMYKILNITDPEVEYVAMLVGEMQGNMRDVPRPGSIELACSVAFAYTVPSADGMRAAVHAGRLGGVDEDCDAVCRAVYSLIVYAVEGKITDKDDLIKIAALNSDVESVARALRAVRLSEWRKLPKESTLIGRLTRVLFLWRRSEGFADAVSIGSRKLHYPESRKLLAVLSACWTDLPYLPENFVWKALMTKDNREICAELYNLSDEAILAKVPESLVYSSPEGVVSRSRESIDGVPVDSDVGTLVTQGKQEERVNIRTPGVPGVPAVPAGLGGIQRPAAPAAPEYAELKRMEEQELPEIEPLKTLDGEREKTVRVVKPVDLFGETFFAE